jgi:hypothetical protein
MPGLVPGIHALLSLLRVIGIEGASRLLPSHTTVHHEVKNLRTHRAGIGVLGRVHRIAALRAVVRRFSQCEPLSIQNLLERRTFNKLRHARTCSGHPRLSCPISAKVRRGWPGPSGRSRPSSTGYCPAKMEFYLKVRCTRFPGCRLSRRRSARRRRSSSPRSTRLSDNPAGGFDK